MNRFLPALFALVLVACAAETVLSDVWVADDAKGQRFANIVVIGIGPDESRRAMFEDAMAARIGHAKASHTLITLAELTDRDAAQKKLLEAGFDGALVVRLIRIETQDYTAPEMEKALDPRNTDLNSIWAPEYHAFDHPTDRTTTTVALETQFFNIKTRERLFRAQSRTYNPLDIDAAAHGLYDAVTAELKKRGVL